MGTLFKTPHERLILGTSGSPGWVSFPKSTQLRVREAAEEEAENPKKELEAGSEGVQGFMSAPWFVAHLSFRVQGLGL